MKIFNYQFYIHKHKFEDKFEVFETMFGDWVIKAYKECTTPNCKLGSYPQITWIFCKGKPTVTKVEL